MITCKHVFRVLVPRGTRLMCVKCGKVIERKP